MQLFKPPVSAEQVLGCEYFPLFPTGMWGLERLNLDFLFAYVLCFDLLSRAVCLLRRAAVV